RGVRDAPVKATGTVPHFPDCGLAVPSHTVVQRQLTANFPCILEEHRPGPLAVVRILVVRDSGGAGPAQQKTRVAVTDAAPAQALPLGGGQRGLLIAEV